MPRSPALSTWIAVLAGLLLPVSAFAHKVSYVTVAASFDTRERTFSVEMAMEVDPTEDAALNAQISPEQAAGTFATEVLSLYFGDTEVSAEPKIDLIEPEPEDVDPNFPERRKVLVELAGDIPDGADYFTLHLSEDNEATVIMVKIVDGKPGRRAEVMYPGEFSTPVDIRKMVDGDPFSLGEKGKGKGTGKGEGTAAEAAAGDSTSGDTPPSMPAAAGAEEPGPDGGEPSLFWTSFKEGFTRVLPQGFEILIALLAMFFLSPKTPAVMRQVAAFVVSLCCTLSLTTLADFNITSPFFGALALLAVALLALENLFHPRLRWWRVVAVSATGCLFGLWIAQEIGITPGMGISQAAIAVSAQLLGLVFAIAVAVAVLMAAVGPMRRHDWYAKSVAFPANLITLGLAVFWLICHA